MPFHVSLHLDDVITGYIGCVAPKVFRALPNERSRSNLVERGAILLLTRGPARGHRGQIPGCG